MKPHVMLLCVVLHEEIGKGLVRVRRCEDELKRRMKTLFESYNVSGSLDEPKVRRDDLCQSPRSSDCFAVSGRKQTTLGFTSRSPFAQSQADGGHAATPARRPSPSRQEKPEIKPPTW